MTLPVALRAEGHQLEKPTTLIGDLPGMSSLTRILTKDKREKYRVQRERKNLPPMYIKTPDGKVHGTKHLKKSAEYPARFCNDVVKVWARARLEATTPEIIEIDWRPIHTDAWLAAQVGRVLLIMWSSCRKMCRAFQVFSFFFWWVWWVCSYSRANRRSATNK